MAQYIPTDPLFAQQWNLLNTGQTGFGPGNIDLNVTYVWPDYTGNGVTIAVYDNGVDYNHVDLNDNYDASQHVIIGGSPSDANWLPPGSVGGSTGFNSINAHGTGMAGIAAAENNGEGMVGVAFDATLVGVYTPIFVPTPSSQLIEAFQQLDNFDVALFASGGRSYRDGTTATGWSDIHTALQSAVTDGRDGLGTVILNGTHNNGPGGPTPQNYDVNASQWDATRFAVHVGGITDMGFVADYVNRSAAMLVSGIPGLGGFGSPRATTSTDITGADGVDPGDYSSGAGTTSAGSQVAGVAALMLEANPDLGWRDVQNIFASSARHTGSAVGGPPDAGMSETDTWEFNGANTWNGGGRHYSIDYGYGYVDALAAVRMAETWHIGAAGAATSANEANRSASNAHGTVAIPDNDGNSVQIQFTVADNIRVETAQLRLGFTHANPEDLQIVLTSPDGTASTILHVMDDGTAPSVTGGGWRFNSQEFRGELSAGTWTATITDLRSGNTGSLSASSALVFFGSPNITSDKYVYTNEFSDYAALTGRSTLTDINGGTDTINAAAVAAASSINLNAGSSSTIDGQTVTIAAGSDIEAAIGGDGNDTLIGNALANILAGGRGADSLTGGLNADSFAFIAAAVKDGQSGVFDTVADYNQSGGAYDASEGDTLDVSAIVSKAFNAGQPVSSLVRVVTDPGGTFAKLQVDADGAANGGNFVTIARLNGLEAGDVVGVVLDPGQLSPTNITVASPNIRNDFDGNGRSDILWQNDNGTPAVWLMDGTNLATAGPALANPGPAWHEIAAGDFNADGKADILWQNDDGTAAVWLMDGTGVAEYGAPLANPGPSWHAKKAADFDGDGKADIVWQNDDGTAAVWLMDGTGAAAYGAALPNPGSAWQLKDAADFNGDGKADILWQNDDGTPAVWLMEGTNLAAAGPALANPGPTWHAEAAADFDGDGKADILWQNDDGTPAVWLMDGTNATNYGPALSNPGPTWHVKEAGDFNADGMADILWQNESGVAAVWLMTGTDVAEFGGPLSDPGAAWHII